MEKHIIIINGTGGSGKDTFIGFCSKYASVMNFSSIDKIKEAAKICGWNGEKADKDRNFLSDLKKIVSQYNDLPFRSMADTIKTFRNSDKEILFLHVREPNEIQRVVDTFNAKTLLIKRKGLENIGTNNADANVDNYSYDYIIKNNSLADLNASALDFVAKLKTLKHHE